MPEHGDPTTGHASEEVEGGQHGTRRRVVAVVDDRRPSQAHELGAMGRGPAALEARHDRVGVESGRDADRRTSQCVVDRQAAQDRDGDPALAGWRVRSWKRIPSTPALVTASARTWAVSAKP